MPAALPRLLLALAALVLAGCGGSPGVAAGAAPLVLEGSAYELAAAHQLPPREAQELPGLHNVQVLSEAIISGAEPDGPQAFEELARLGVRTILSVDGKLPDVALAEQHGMRYVHVPIQYRGITGDEQARLLKTFRELEGPFYVHCFHGVHRGPAAAALGRVAIDGAPREQALAEMRQWCGTSPKYEGLYRTVATAELPSADATAALDYGFDAATPLGDFAGFMVELARPFDRIKGMARNGWKVQADHPDLDPVNEAAILAQLLERAPELGDGQGEPEEFRHLLGASGPQARALHAALRADREAGQGWEASQAALDQLDATCNACHAGYRN